jgi:hypothetical protein
MTHQKIKWEKAFLFASFYSSLQSEGQRLKFSRANSTSDPFIKNNPSTNPGQVNLIPGCFILTYRMYPTKRFTKEYLNCTVRTYQSTRKGHFKKKIIQLHNCISQQINVK